MTGDNSRPESQDNDGSRAYPCCIMNETTWSRELNHQQRSLLGALLFNLKIPLNKAINCYGLQEDFKLRRTRYELKRIYHKQFRTPTCMKLYRSGLCYKYCGRTFPDLQFCESRLEAFLTRTVRKPIEKNFTTSVILKTREYYQSHFRAPNNIDYKFRFFKIETKDRWITITAQNPADLTRVIRKVSVNEHVLGVFYSLGKFVSPRWAEKDHNYILIDYCPVLDYDLHTKLNRESMDYKEQNKLFLALFKQKIESLNDKALLNRIVFTGGGFHFYVNMSKDEAKKHAKETQADPIFDCKRVARLENSLNLKYGDIRICREVKGCFNLDDFLLSP